MFVGYENFSTYFVDADETFSADFISNDDGIQLPDEYQLESRPADPWFYKSACSDFVVLAEFYELEGPMPRVSVIVLLYDTYN
jgi:hypothetical protein